MPVLHPMKLFCVIAPLKPSGPTLAQNSVLLPIIRSNSEKKRSFRFGVYSQIRPDNGPIPENNGLDKVLTLSN